MPAVDVAVGVEVACAEESVWVAVGVSVAGPVGVATPVMVPVASVAVAACGVAVKGEGVCVAEMPMSLRRAMVV